MSLMFQFNDAIETVKTYWILFQLDFAIIEYERGLNQCQIFRLFESDKLIFIILINWKTSRFLNMLQICIWMVLLLSNRMILWVLYITLSSSIIIYTKCTEEIDNVKHWICTLSSFLLQIWWTQCPCVVRDFFHHISAHVQKV